MKLLSDAGIYLISDLSDPTQSIDRSDPTWLTSLYSRYTSVIDELSQYNNTIGFFAGNEVANTIATTDSAAFVKAAVRDMKKYISYGASPRASIALVSGARALAFLHGRDYALPEDVGELALDVLRHRVVLSYEALADDVTPDTIITRVLDAVEAPEVVLSSR